MNYDILIIGGGPAGLTAGVYAKRAGRSVAIIEKGVLGGQVAFTNEVRNYPGSGYISGEALADNLTEHARLLGVEFLIGQALSVEKIDDGFRVKYTRGELECKSLILAMGSSARFLGVQGEKEFAGHGVSYCATCDGSFFKGMNVAVVGGGDTAFEDIKYLSNLAKKVYAIHRSDHYVANQQVQDEVAELVKAGKVEMLPFNVVQQINGDKHVTSIVIHDTRNDASQELQVEGVFVAIGAEPNSELAKGLVDMNEKGYIIVDENQATSTPGIYCAGDISTTTLRQIVTACADGARAGNEASKYVKR